MHEHSVKKDGENGQLDLGYIALLRQLASSARLGPQSLENTDNIPESMSPIRIQT